MMLSLIDSITKALDGKRSTKGNYIAKCPAHDDKNRSFTYSTKEGKLLLKCFAGCDFNDIRKVLEANGVIPPLQKVETYDTTYHHMHLDPIMGEMHFEADGTDYSVVDNYYLHEADGQLLGSVLRLKPKSFRHFVHRGFNDNRAQRNKNVPWNLPEVIQALNEEEPIHKFEGYKDAKNAAKYGLVSTSWGGSTDLPAPEYAGLIFRPGSRWVIWQDNDAAGIKCAQREALIMHNAGCLVKIVTVPVGKDFSDWEHHANSR